MRETSDIIEIRLWRQGKVKRMQNQNEVVRFCQPFEKHIHQMGHLPLIRVEIQTCQPI